MIEPSNGSGKHILMLNLLAFGILIESRRRKGLVQRAAQLSKIDVNSSKFHDI